MSLELICYNSCGLSSTQNFEGKLLHLMIVDGIIKIYVGVVIKKNKDKILKEVGQFTLLIYSLN